MPENPSTEDIRKALAEHSIQEVLPVETVAAILRKDAPAAALEPHFRALVDILSPPSGTSFYQYFPIAPLPNQVLKGQYSSGKMNWEADVHVYATGALPSDAEGWSQRGVLKLAVVHRAQTSFNIGTPPLTFRVECGSRSTLLPETYSGVADGDETKYTIDFHQDLPLFKGQEPFTFSAKYGKDFWYKGWTQEGRYIADPATAGVEFKAKMDDSDEHDKNIETYAFSVTTFPTGYWSNFTLKFFFTYVSIDIEFPGGIVTKDVTLSADFPVTLQSRI